jgi:hypothetical protein
MVGAIRVLILLFIILTISLILLSSTKAGKFGIEVQDVEINPAVAIIGDLVRIKLNIINTERNNINCKITAFCGDSALDTVETKVGWLSSIPLSFELDTGCMSSGVYSIEAIVEADSGQQKLFSLGYFSADEKLTINEGIPIEEAEPSLDESGEAESTKNTFVSTNSTSFNWE